MQQIQEEAVCVCVLNGDWQGWEDRGFMYSHNIPLRRKSSGWWSWIKRRGSATVQTPVITQPASYQLHLIPVLVRKERPHQLTICFLGFTSQNLESALALVDKSVAWMVSTYILMSFCTKNRYGSFSLFNRYRSRCPICSSRPHYTISSTYFTISFLQDKKVAGKGHLTSRDTAGFTKRRLLNSQHDTKAFL